MPYQLIINFSISKTKIKDNISFKVAIASENGLFIDEHFGRAPHFLIQALNKIINKVIDCRFVLAEKIGPDAKFKLSSNNIR